MLFSQILFLATAVSAVVLPRDVAETKKNLADIDSKTNALTSATNKWDGTLFGATAISNAEDALEKSITNAINAAGDEAQANSADSQSVLSYVTGTLEPDINAALNAIVKRKADFDKNSLSSRVKTNLATLRSDSAKYSDALINIASADQKSNGQAAKTRIDNAFANAQKSFP